MWVRFVHEHWHRFTAQMKRRYPKDTVANVPKAVADKAIAEGHAVAMRKRSRHAKPEVIDDVDTGDRNRRMGDDLGRENDPND